MLIYFANNRVAYLINPMSNSFTKYNLKQDEKKQLFFDEEYGLFPQLKPIFDQFSKSNKWLREHEFHAIMSKILFEGLGDKAYYELQKKKSKPNYGQLVFLKNIRLAGSYDNNKLKELGFFMKNGEWAISKPKYDSIVRDGKLREMSINRPLLTGKNKIPNVGKKKVHENVWAFDAEKALELLKEPLLRGGGDDDPDLDCDMCGGHGCGSGYDIKDDLARWKKMLNPDADNRPEHLTNQYIEAKIKQLEAMVKKYPNGIPDNIDCSGGMSQQKHREWESNKGHDAADVLSDVIGDDGFHDDLYGIGPDEDVRPLIMNWLNPEWRKKDRPGLPEYPAVEDVDFAELYRRARQIYNPLTLVKEGKKLPRTSEFLYQKVDEVEDIKRLSGVYDNYQIPVHVEGATSASMGSNISKTASEISKIMKEKNIQPGTAGMVSTMVFKAIFNRRKTNRETIMRAKEFITESPVVPLLRFLAPVLARMGVKKFAMMLLTFLFTTTAGLTITAVLALVQLIITATINMAVTGVSVGAKAIYNAFADAVGEDEADRLIKELDVEFINAGRMMTYLSYHA